MDEAKLQFAHLSQHNQHLNLVLSDKAEEVANLRSKYEGNEKRLYESEDAKKMLKVLSEDNSKLSSMLNEYKKRVKGYENNGQLDSNINLVVNENQRLNDLLTKYMKESDILRKELDNLRVANAEIVKKASSLSPEIRSKHMKSDSAMEISPVIVKGGYHDTERFGIKNAEEKLRVMADENVRLNKLLQDTSKDISSWKNRYLSGSDLRKTIA